MDFDNLYAEALNAWPPEVRLPVRSFVTGHLVDGLTDLEHSIAAQWAGRPHEVLMATLNWTILRAVHAAFATRQSVVMAELPSIRERFETELRLLLQRPHWKELDSKIIREYFGEKRTPFLMRSPKLSRARRYREQQLVRRSSASKGGSDEDSMGGG